LFAGIAVGEVNTGSNNAFFGFNAGAANTTGSLNAFFGQAAGQANTTGDINTFFGGGAGQHNTTGVRNSFFGALAGVFNTTGGFNAFFGTSSAFNNTTGNRNAFFGNQSGQSNTSGSSNVIVGDTAGFNNTTGTGNTFVGQGSGGSNTTENENTFLGSHASGAASITNSTAIGANATVTQSDSVVLGNNARVGIGTSSPTSKLDVIGRVEIEGTADARFASLHDNSANGIAGYEAYPPGSSGVGGFILASARGTAKHLTNIADDDSYIAIRGANYSFHVGTSAQSPSMTVRGDSGNVGIGTTAPQAQLHVQGGNIFVGAPGQGIILKSPDGNTCRVLTIDNTGALTLSAITCP